MNLIFNLFSIQEILIDPNIIKVSTVPDKDAEYLRDDYDVFVKSTLDLRYLAREAGCEPNGLTTMSEHLLGKSLDRSWYLRKSDWNASTLASDQIDFASEKPKAVMDLFQFFAKKLLSGRRFSNDAQQLNFFIENYCLKYLNRKY